MVAFRRPRVSLPARRALSRAPNSREPRRAREERAEPRPSRRDAPTPRVWPRPPVVALLSPRARARALSRAPLACALYPPTRAPCARSARAGASTFASPGTWEPHRTPPGAPTRFARSPAPPRTLVAAHRARRVASNPPARAATASPPRSTPRVSLPPAPHAPAPPARRAPRDSVRSAPVSPVGSPRSDRSSLDAPPFVDAMTHPCLPRARHRDRDESLLENAHTRVRAVARVHRARRLARRARRRRRVDVVASPRARACADRGTVARRARAMTSRHAATPRSSRRARGARRGDAS